MPTLLLSRGLQPEANELATVAEQNSWRVRWLEAADDLTDFRAVVYAFYGDTVAGTKFGKSPHFALIEPTLDLLTILPHRYTKRRIDYATLADAFHIPGAFFIKSADPCHRRMDSCVWESGASIKRLSDIPLDAPVLIAEPVTWSVEYRMIVLERQVVTFAPYARRGRRAQVIEEPWPYDREEATEIMSGCEEFLADLAVSLPPAFVLDVGLIEQGGWAVVEFNPIWCSRLFACDRSRLLPVLQRACLKREQMDDADRQWIINR